MPGGPACFSADALCWPYSKGIDVPAPECCTAAIAVHSFRSWLWTKWLIGS
jgi:hypothetical protein